MQASYSSSGDDGLTDSRNLLPNSIHLGQIADFWKRYDSVADSHDRRLSKHLNDNLDVLLIFAGLFSAINTAFISFTMPALSPNPSAETNALLRALISIADNRTLAAFEPPEPFTPQPISIAMNCLLYASLACSLVAAIGAMMCKEWLHSLDRSGQTGPVEDQGRLRQRKFDGAQRWQLETIIDFMPTIVLISITLFFIGVVVFLLSLNKAVAFFVIAFGAFWGVLGTGSILASAIFQFCPYETATSRTLRKIIRILDTWRTRLRGVDPTDTGRQVVKRACKSLLSLYGRSKEALVRVLSDPEPEDTLPMQDQPNRSYTLDTSNKNAKKDHEQQVTNSQAALWLLEMAHSREDQLIAVRFLYTTPREACAVVFTNWERLQLVISLTLQTFDIWRSQPNEKTQETVQHFGRALCHVLPQTREGTERWKELIPPAQSWRLGLGERFLRELGSFEQTASLSDNVGEEYVLQSALLRTLILTKDIPIETYRWTNLKFLIMKQDPNSQLLGLWAKLVYKGFGHSEKYHLRRFPSAGAVVSRKARDSVKRDVAENDFPLALACGVQTLKSVERQAGPDNLVSMVLDAVEIYTACVHKTTQLAEADQLHSASQGLVADAMTGFMLYFKKSAFLNPPERQLYDFIISALRLLRSIHNSGYTANLDDAAFDGLWYALDSIISGIDSSSEVDRGSIDDEVLETLELVSEWLPVKYGVYSPMVGLEAHSQIIEYITWHLVDEFQKSEGRVVHLMYKNRFRWFTQASSALRTAWMDADLGSHLVDALRRPDAWKNTALLVRILEDITEMSMEWCRKLVADGFIISVADVILNFDQVEDNNPVRRRCIQCRLTRALLSVWRHCSAITEIKWPKEKMLLVINSASSATEWLLGRDATQVGPEASQNVALGKDAIVDIRNKLKLFFDWTTERPPQSALISGDASQAISALLIEQTDGESPSTSRFRVSRTCSRDSYIENNLL